MANILIVEDDKELNNLVCSYLKENGYNVTCCYNGAQALKELEKNINFDLILSDIMMPEMDGFTLVEKIRKSNSQTPIIFMTARDDKFSKQIGYKIGIDDYIVKPFDVEELVLKIGAILRRFNNINNKLVVGNLTLDKSEHTAYLDSKEMPLTVKEFDLLFKFLSNPKKTFTRSQLMNEFWDFDTSATSRTVDVYMAKLRDKTSKCDGFEIITVHGLGYKAVLNEEN